MSYSKTPHACFKVEGASIGRTDDELPRMLTNHLQTRFASARVKKMPFFGSWTVELQVGPESSFTIMLNRSKYGNDEWVLLLDPLQSRGLLDILRGHKPTGSSSGLMQACRDIHAYLTATPGITAVRWYFEGFRSQTAAVATPDELPWSTV